MKMIVGQLASCIVHFALGKFPVNIVIFQRDGNEAKGGVV